MSELRVRVADAAVGTGDVLISTIGLGSCVAIVLYDAAARIGGMAHVLRPSVTMSHDGSNRAKFPVSPYLPDWLDAVIEYRGRVIAVIDLRHFARPPLAPRLETRILVFQIGDEWIGTIMHAVLEVATVMPEEIAPSPALLRGLPADFVQGLVRRGSRLIGLLNVPHLLSITERLELTEMAREAPAA